MEWKRGMLGEDACRVGITAAPNAKTTPTATVIKMPHQEKQYSMEFPIALMAPTRIHSEY
ncbi:MAG: hypothetical protein GY850_19025 [bacterium]|nr:hypothetical protein [bacterium]